MKIQTIATVAIAGLLLGLALPGQADPNKSTAQVRSKGTQSTNSSSSDEGYNQGRGNGSRSTAEDGPASQDSDSSQQDQGQGETPILTQPPS